MNAISINFDFSTLFDLVTMKSNKLNPTNQKMEGKTKTHRPNNANLINNTEKELESSNKNIVLIVEDEEVNYLYIETLLENSEINFKILHAKNGQEAVNICKENSEIDIILMDLKMPILNGFEAAKQIKIVSPKIPIIAQTAYSTKEEKQKALSAGCDDFISKPINAETLTKKINKFLQLNN